MMSFRDWNHRLEDLPGALFVHDGKVELGAARAFRLLILPAELTGEQATGERAPNEEADLFGFQNVSTTGTNVIAARADTRVSLRRKHDVLAGNVEILERLPKSRLTFTFRVDVCCIEEINAAVDRSLDQFVGSLLVDRPDDPVD